MSRERYAVASRFVALRLVPTEAVVPLVAHQFSRAELERMTNGPSWQSGNAKAMLAKLDRGEKLAMIYEARWLSGNSAVRLTCPSTGLPSTTRWPSTNSSVTTIALPWI